MARTTDTDGGFHASPVAHLMLDPACRVVAANRAATDLLGRAPAAVVGAHVCAALNGCPHAGDACPYPSCPVKSGTFVAGTSGAVAVVAGGIPGFVVETQVAAVDTGGDDGPVVVALLDQRASDNRRRRDFLALIAHELRTPLTVALSHAELLVEAADSFDEATRTEMARDVLEAVERLSLQVDELANLGQAAAGDLTPTVEDVDLGAALDEGLRRAGAGELAELGQGLSGIPAARADRARAARALAALVIEARRASRGASPEVRGTADAEAVVVEVVDSGPVIPEPERAAVFDKLGRSVAQRRSTRVTGLGVTVARVLVESMGGSVAVTAREDGGGCVFTVRLPRG